MAEPSTLNSISLPIPKNGQDYPPEILADNSADYTKEVIAPFTLSADVQTFVNPNPLTIDEIIIAYYNATANKALRRSFVSGFVAGLVAEGTLTAYPNGTFGL